MSWNALAMQHVDNGSSIALGVELLPFAAFAFCKWVCGFEPVYPNGGSLSKTSRSSEALNFLSGMEGPAEPAVGASIPSSR